MASGSMSGSEWQNARGIGFEPPDDLRTEAVRSWPVMPC